MAVGFGLKTVNYLLEISEETDSRFRSVAKIPFIVAWEKNLKTTDQRAINTAGLLWGLFMNGTQELHDAVADKLDCASADAILELYNERNGRRNIGHLKVYTDNGKKLRLVEYASEPNMRRNLKKYEAIDFAAQL